MDLVQQVAVAAATRPATVTLCERSAGAGPTMKVGWLSTGSSQPEGHQPTKCQHKECRHRITGLCGLGSDVHLVEVDTTQSLVPFSDWLVNGREKKLTHL